MTTTHTFIRINNEKLYLDELTYDADELGIFDGYDEQCEGCGESIAEQGTLNRARGMVICHCGAEYEIENDPPERGGIPMRTADGPPFDAATATGMYDGW